MVQKCYEEISFDFIYSPSHFNFFLCRLIWFLWRQACKVEPSDPESVITELEAACTETHLTHQEGAVSDAIILLYHHATLFIRIFLPKNEFFSFKIVFR